LKLLIALMSMGGLPGVARLAALMPTGSPSVKHTASVDVSDLVLRPGDRCRTFGRLVRVGDLVTFEPPMTRAMPAYPAGREPAPQPSPPGMPITGINLTDVLDRREKDGAIEGWATVECVWNADTLHAIEQRAERPPVIHHPRWTEPPCPPPADGWPGGHAFMLPPELHHELAAAGLSLNMTLFHPTGSGPVLVIAASDPDAVIARLGTFATPRICVVQSRYSRAEIVDMRQELQARFIDRRSFGSGQTSSADGQIRFFVQVVRVVPELAAWAANVSEGLLEVHAWLAPLHLAERGP
jgi:hypothetical protein